MCSEHPWTPKLSWKSPVERFPWVIFFTPLFSDVKEVAFVWFFFSLILPQCWRGKGLATNKGEIQDKLTDKMFPFKTASIGSIYLVLHIYWILWKGLNRVSYLNTKFILGGRGYHNLHVIGQGTEIQRRMVAYPNLVTSEQEFTCSHGQLHNSKGLTTPHTLLFTWPCTSCLYHLNFLPLASLNCHVSQYLLEYLFGLY